jgi:hypothetical protein
MARFVIRNQRGEYLRTKKAYKRPLWGSLEDARIFTTKAIASSMGRSFGGRLEVVKVTEVRLVPVEPEA